MLLSGCDAEETPVMHNYEEMNRASNLIQQGVSNKCCYFECVTTFYCFFTQALLDRRQPGHPGREQVEVGQRHQLPVRLRSEEGE